MSYNIGDYIIKDHVKILLIILLVMAGIVPSGAGTPAMNITSWGNNQTNNQNLNINVINNTVVRFNITTNTNIDSIGGSWCGTGSVVGGDGETPTTYYIDCKFSAL